MTRGPFGVLFETEKGETMKTPLALTLAHQAKATEALALYEDCFPSEMESHENWDWWHADREMSLYVYLRDGAGLFSVRFKENSTEVEKVEFTRTL